MSFLSACVTIFVICWTISSVVFTASLAKWMTALVTSSLCWLLICSRFHTSRACQVYCRVFCILIFRCALVNSTWRHVWITLSKLKSAAGISINFSEHFLSLTSLMNPSGQQVVPHWSRYERINNGNSVFSRSPPWQFLHIEWGWLRRHIDWKLIIPYYNA